MDFFHGVAFAVGISAGAYLGYGSGFESGYSMGADMMREKLLSTLTAAADEYRARNNPAIAEMLDILKSAAE
jgi:hypothetical protein